MSEKREVYVIHEGLDGVFMPSTSTVCETVAEVKATMLAIKRQLRDNGCIVIGRWDTWYEYRYVDQDWYPYSVTWAQKELTAEEIKYLQEYR